MNISDLDREAYSLLHFFVYTDSLFSEDDRCMLCGISTINPNTQHKTFCEVDRARNILFWRGYAEKAQLQSIGLSLGILDVIGLNDEVK